jgi:hypothetical protein
LLHREQGCSGLAPSLRHGNAYPSVVDAREMVNGFSTGDYDRGAVAGDLFESPPALAFDPLPELGRELVEPYRRSSASGYLA